MSIAGALRYLAGLDPELKDARPAWLSVGITRFMLVASSAILIACSTTQFPNQLPNQFVDVEVAGETVAVDAQMLREYRPKNEVELLDADSVSLAYMARAHLLIGEQIEADLLLDELERRGEAAFAIGAPHAPFGIGEPNPADTVYSVDLAQVGEAFRIGGRTNAADRAAEILKGLSLTSGNRCIAYSEYDSDLGCIHNVNAIASSFLSLVGEDVAVFADYLEETMVAPGVWYYWQEAPPDRLTKNDAGHAAWMTFYLLSSANEKAQRLGALSAQNLKANYDRKNEFWRYQFGAAAALVKARERDGCELAADLPRWAKANASEDPTGRHRRWASFVHVYAQIECPAILRNSNKFARGDWHQLLLSADFDPRDTAHGFKFAGRLWLSNGWTHSGVPIRDLWSSLDGIEWKQELEKTPYDPYSGMAVLGDSIYAVNRTVWKSADGLNWTKVGSTPIVRESSLPYLVAYNDMLYVFVVEGAWRSKDGVIWEEINIPDALKRGSYAITEFQGSIWLMGGGKRMTASPPEKGDPIKTSFNDIWRYTDQSGWQLVSSHAPWRERMWPTAIVSNDRMFVVGGLDNRQGKNISDTWVTSDGLRWYEVQTLTKFSPRHWPTLFELDDSIILVGGNAYPVVNDVWSFDAAELAIPDAVP